QRLCPSPAFRALLFRRPAVVGAAGHVRRRAAIGIAHAALDVLVRTRHVLLRQIGRAISATHAAVRCRVTFVRLTQIVIRYMPAHTALFLDVVLLARERLRIDDTLGRGHFGGILLGHKALLVSLCD